MVIIILLSRDTTFFITVDVTYDCCILVVSMVGSFESDIAAITIFHLSVLLKRLWKMLSRALLLLYNCSRYCFRHILFTKSCVNEFFISFLFQTPLLIISFVSLFGSDQAQRVNFSGASSLSDGHRRILVMLLIAFLGTFFK